MGCGSSVSRYHREEEEEEGEPDEGAREQCDGPPRGPLAAATAPAGAWSAPGRRPCGAAAARAAAAAPAAAAGEWQLERSPGAWTPLPAERSRSLLEAYYAGESRVVYSAQDGATCEVDFGACLHTDWRTGVQARLRWAAGAPGAPASQPAAAAVPSQSGMYDAAYQWQLKNGAWVDFEDEEQHDLLLAWRSGKNVYRYAARGLQYEVDFQWMRQTNLCTKHARSIRVRIHEDPCAGIAVTLGAVPPKEEPAWDTYWHIGGERRPLDGPAAASSEADRPPEAAGAAEPQPRGPPPPPAPSGGAGGAASSTGGGQGTAAPAGRHKKHSLRPGGHPAAAPRPDRRTGAPPGAPAGEARGAAGGGQRPPAGAAEPEAGPVALPDGAAWPADASAREAAAALFAQLASSRAAAASSPAERRGLYRAQCLAWHPDKNLDREDLATEVFQFLQLLRGWYLQP